MEVDEEQKPMEVDEAPAPLTIFDEMLDKARDLETTNPEQAIVAYKAIIHHKDDEGADAAARGREQAITALGECFVKQRRATGITELMAELRPLFSELPKAKTAKIVRCLIDLLAKIPASESLQIEMCTDCIEWCKGEKRTFLRQRVETRLAALFLAEKKYTDALDLLGKVVAEVKKLDDKLLLVEIHMIECRTHFALQNVPKAKAALTSAKTNANAIHCPPIVQADIDLWSGVIASREKDFRTGYSYFYEAFEAFNASETADKAKTALKYMLLTKIMQNRPNEIKQLVNSKHGLKYIGAEIDAMSAVAAAHEQRCLKKFEKVLDQYKDALSGDPIVKFHLSDLNESLLGQNINRILEPFSRVEIAHVAELIELPLERTLSKLREMILDKKLNGTLDQGIGVLIVFEQEQVRSTYDHALKTVKNTSDVLETLYGMAKQIA